MDNIVETAQYNSNGSPSPGTLPDPWCRCEHPNGDIYYYHPQFRLITPDRISNAETLEHVLEAREDHLQCLANSPNIQILPSDYELVISDTTDETATIWMYSRTTAQAYTYSEERGITTRSRAHFWSHVAEYPAHHPDLPADSEREFVQALANAQTAVQSGARFFFSETQIDQIIARYHYLSNLRSQGQNTTPQLAWLIGAVMPLDEVDRSPVNLAAMMNGIQQT